jgi:hypothetical protein
MTQGWGLIIVVAVVVAMEKQRKVVCSSWVVEWKEGWAATRRVVGVRGRTSMERWWDFDGSIGMWKEGQAGVAFISARTARKVTSWRLLALQGEGGLNFPFPRLEMVVTQKRSFWH